jgi:hypothetical protein
VTPARWQDVGPLETTAAPAGFYARLDDAWLSPAAELGRAQVLASRGARTQTLRRATSIGAVAAAEALPQPKAIEAVVFVDGVSRTAAVRMPDTVGGYERQLWVQAWQRLRRAQEAGWPIDGPRPVFADVPGGRQVRGLPVDGAQLSFHFPVGTPGFAALVGGAVTAVVTVDRGTHQFLTCRFLNRPG